MKNIKVKSFKRRWYRLKSSLTKKDLDFFYEIVDIEGTCGRVFNFSEKPYNPRYMDHWFPTCRCHWGVIFPCWLLNNRSVLGKYAIITNEKHSAIINTETNEVFDPTYEANGSGTKETKKKFKDGYEIESLIYHSLRVDKNIFMRIADSLSNEQRSAAANVIHEKAKQLEEK